MRTRRDFANSVNSRHPIIANRVIWASKTTPPNVMHTITIIKPTKYMALIKRYKSKIYGNYWLGILKFGLLIGFGLSFTLIFRHFIKEPISQPVGFVENFALLGLIFLAVSEVSGVKL